MCKGEGERLLLNMWFPLHIYKKRKKMFLEKSISLIPRTLYDAFYSSIG